jgi:hypothetical protein
MINKFYNKTFELAQFSSQLSVLILPVRIPLNARIARGLLWLCGFSNKFSPSLILLVIQILHFMTKIQPSKVNVIDGCI